MAIPIDSDFNTDKYKKYLDRHKKYLSELNITTSGFSPLPSDLRPITTTNTWTINISDVTATETLEKAFKNEKEEKEKKEMANAKVCDICGAVYSTKKYDKIFDDMDENYDIHLRFFDSCSNDVEICPDCYKALIDKLVERGLEPAEKDDEKDDD